MSDAILIVTDAGLDYQVHNDPEHTRLEAKALVGEPEPSNLHSLEKSQIKPTRKQFHGRLFY